MLGIRPVEPIRLRYIDGCLGVNLHMPK